MNMARNSGIVFSICGILVVIFFMMFSAFAQTFTWVTTTHWMVFSVIILMLVLFMLYRVLD